MQCCKCPSLQHKSDLNKKKANNRTAEVASIKPKIKVVCEEQGWGHKTKVTAHQQKHMQEAGCCEWISQVTEKWKMIQGRLSDDCFLGSVSKENIYEQLVLRFVVNWLHLKFILLNVLCKKILRKMNLISQLKQIQTKHRGSCKSINCLMNYLQI